MKNLIFLLSLIYLGCNIHSQFKLGQIAKLRDPFYKDCIAIIQDKYESIFSYEYLCQIHCEYQIDEFTKQTTDVEKRVSERDLK